LIDSAQRRSDGNPQQASSPPLQGEGWVGMV
jgi:hypothetical protein